MCSSVRSLLRTFTAAEVICLRLTALVADVLSVDGAWHGLRARPSSCTLSGVYVHSRGVSVHSWGCSYTPMGVQRTVLRLSTLSAPVDTTANVWNLSQSFVGLLLRSFSDLLGALLSACRRRQHPTGVRRRHCWPPVSDEPPIGRRCAAFSRSERRRSLRCRAEGGACCPIGCRAKDVVSYAPSQLAACLR